MEPREGGSAPSEVEGGSAPPSGPDAQNDGVAPTTADSGPRPPSPGVPPRELVLYDLSEDRKQRCGEPPRGCLHRAVSIVHVSGEWLYFAEESRLGRGDRHGATPTTLVGSWDHVAPIELASDSEHVYWLDGPVLHRFPHRGGEEEVIALPADHGGGGLAVADDYVYIATWGCTVITRIDKATLQMEPMATQVEPWSSGRTPLRVDDGQVFCGSRGNIVVIPRWGEPARLLVHTESGRIWSMAVTPRDVYWVELPAERGSREALLSFVPRAGGERTNLPGRGPLDHASSVTYSPTDDTLYFLSGYWLASYSPKTGQWALRVHAAVSANVDVDGEYVYWSNGPADWTILRMPLGYPPLELLE